MAQRGVAFEEIEETLNQGWMASDAKPGVLGKVMVFPFDREWQGNMYAEKEVTVYYKQAGERVVLLTVKARYGNKFPRG
jgi:hypothetical protein